MSNTKQRWVKPTLNRLGKIGNVAGNARINADGQSANPKS